MDKTALTRFWAKVEKSETGCWNWTASKDPHGYGVFHLNGKPQRAHRVSMWLDGRETPKGVVVDHVCRNRACVNPAHLRAVDFRTNLFENSQSSALLNSLKTHCPKGHEYAGDNLLLQQGQRKCRACHRKWLNDAWHKKRKFERPSRPEIRERKRLAALAAAKEPPAAEPTRPDEPAPSKGFLKGESPQATWPFAQDDKGTK